MFYNKVRPDSVADFKNTGRMIIVAELKCRSCGHIEESGENMLECPQCGYTLCRRCGFQKQKEKKDLEKLRKGERFERVTTICPSCGYGMFHL